MPRAEWTPFAEQRLEEIAFYIACEDHRPAVAEKIIREIHAKCETYARNPAMGTTASEIGDGCRIFRHKRWVVIYLTVEFGIQVVGIVDAARDFPAWKIDR